MNYTIVTESKWLYYYDSCHDNDRANNHINYQLTKKEFDDKAR